MNPRSNRILWCKRTWCRVADDANRNKPRQRSVSTLSDDLASEFQGQRTCTSEAERYLAMSHRHADIQHDGETFEMLNMGPALDVHSQNHHGGQGSCEGQREKEQYASRIYENMHIRRLDLASPGGNVNPSTGYMNVVRKGSGGNEANIGDTKSALYYNLI